MENRCENCGSANICVVDSRPSRSEFFSMRRRRMCNDCGYRFTTYEVQSKQMFAMAYELYRTYILPSLVEESTRTLAEAFSNVDSATKRIRDTAVQKDEADPKLTGAKRHLPKELRDIHDVLNIEGLF